MRSSVQYPSQPSEWKLWWAWYPIQVSLPDGGRVAVWFENVERRRVPMRNDSYAEYRFPEMRREAL